MALLPVAPEIARSLELLGYRTAAKLETLDVNTLRSQSGQAAHGIAQAALGRGSSQVKTLFPEAARFVFEGTPKRRQQLDAGLSWLAKELGAALRDRDAQGRTVELFMEHEDASVTRITRTFAGALTVEREVQNALGLMLVAPPPAPAECIGARLPDLETTRRVQLDLHDGRSRSDQAEGVRVALAHVLGVYGNGSVRLVSEIREFRRIRVRKAYRELNGLMWA